MPPGPQASGLKLQVGTLDGDKSYSSNTNGTYRIPPVCFGYGSVGWLDSNEYVFRSSRYR